MTLDEMKLAVASKLPELIVIEHQEAECFQSPFGDGLIDMPEQWLMEWKNLPEGRISGHINWPTEGLQVCHEAEKLLTEKESVWYLQRLAQVRLRQGHGGMIACMIDKLAYATYEQRLEALCRIWFPQRFQ